PVGLHAVALSGLLLSPSGISRRRLVSVRSLGRNARQLHAPTARPEAPGAGAEASVAGEPLPQPRSSSNARRPPGQARTRRGLRVWSPPVRREPGRRGNGGRRPLGGRRRGSAEQPGARAVPPHPGRRPRSAFAGRPLRRRLVV